MKKRSWLFIILLPLSVSATEFFETHRNARAMGLGGAYAAIVEDDESLWYNPAGIGKNSGIFWTLADPGAGLSNAEAFTQLTDLQDAASFATTLDGLYGEPIWVGANAKSALIMPFFSFAYFYDVDASIIVDNPSSPTMTTNYIMDQGYALGSGFTIGGIFQMGFAAKYITRTGIREQWGPSTIADIVGGSSTPDAIFDTIFDTKGVGYAFDMGVNLILPTIVQPTISFVWKNIGDTKFRATSQSANDPPTERQSMTVGASMLVDLTLVHFIPIVEARHIEDSGQIGKKLHMGVEVGIPFVDLRAGLYQGYYTAGVGLNMGIVRIDAATWGVELGEYPGQKEDRRYMVQATVNIGFDFGFGEGGSGSSGGSSSSASAGRSGGGGGGATGGKSGKAGSFFKLKKPKQRR